MNRSTFLLLPPGASIPDRAPMEFPTLADLAAHIVGAAGQQAVNLTNVKGGGRPDLPETRVAVHTALIDGRNDRFIGEAWLDGNDTRLRHAMAKAPTAPPTAATDALGLIADSSALRARDARERVLARPNGFLTAVEAAERNCRRHRQEPRDFAVERDGQWPTLFEAFETISHDSGSGAGHEVYFVPEAWTEDLDNIEAALHGLTSDELQAFAIGEDTQSAAIAARSLILTAAHLLLDAFFEDWGEIAGGDDGEIETCGICQVAFVQGDLCLTDISLGPVHARCCGPERESYVNLETGEPLADDAPIPTPWIWNADGTISPGAEAAA